MPDPIYFQWQNEFLLRTIYPLRETKLRDFLRTRYVPAARETTAGGGTAGPVGQTVGSSTDSRRGPPCRCTTTTSLHSTGASTRGSPITPGSSH